MLYNFDGSQHYLNGNQVFWKSQMAVLSGPVGAKSLLAVFKGSDQQGGSEFHWVIEGSLGVWTPILGSEGS